MDGERCEISFSPPDITELEINEVVDVLKSGWITTGPRTKLLEEHIAKYIGVEKCVCLNSGTAALELTLRILGVGEGDEVITTPYTYTATASVVEHVGAKLVLVDLEADSYEMNYEQLSNYINENTKVIIPVDIGGVMCDYEKIFDIVENKKEVFKANSKLQAIYNRVVILADSAHGFGASQSDCKSGNVADFTAFSFHAVKNLTTGEGGAIVWKNKQNLDNDWLYKQYRLYALHGQSKDALEKTKKGAWEYDIILPGYKCNMTDIQAALGLMQLSRYQEMLARRKEIVSIYDEAFKELPVSILKHSGSNHQSSMHLYLVRINGIDESVRNIVINKMSELGIPCNVHYKPLPMLSAYKKLGYNIKDYPNAFKQYQNEITLPLHTKLTDEDVLFIVESFKSVLKLKY